MVRRTCLVVVIALGGFLGACASSDADSAATDDGAAGVAVGSPPVAPVEAAPAADVGSIGDAVEVAAGAVDGAQVAACQATRETLDQASEAFFVLNGAPPAAQTDLLDAQLIREGSPWFEIDASGTVVPVTGGPCV